MSVSLPIVFFNFDPACPSAAASNPTPLEGDRPLCISGWNVGAATLQATGAAFQRGHFAIGSIYSTATGSSAMIAKDDPIVNKALAGILAIETSQKFSVAPQKVRRTEVLTFLGGDSSRGKEALQVLKRLGYARFVLFGCVELTRAGRLAALRIVSGI
jgi:hypothetical protein